MAETRGKFPRATAQSSSAQPTLDQDEDKMAKWRQKFVQVF